MSSTNYRIDWDVINAGGSDSSSSASYQLRDSIGGVAEGNSTSTSYSFDAGHRGGIYDRVVDFNLYLQDRSSQVGSSALSGTTVTIASTSGFSADQMVAIVQDEGASQSTAIGKITSVSGSDLIIDSLSGDSLTIDGSNDVVYRLNASSLSLGTLTGSSVATSIVAWEASGDVDSGFDIYISEDTDLIDGSNTITDVSDGAVTAGSTEYGARASDSSITSSTFDTQDTAITTTLAAIATESASIFASRNFITLKAGMTSSQTDGSYSHVLTVLYVGNY
ncbi:hypothetical protein HON52_00165 [Candidatus Uhrbacteria bacterium]|nr:hypothetical protein [Candidatus Uhrbacteria bacterium]